MVDCCITASSKIYRTHIALRHYRCHHTIIISITVTLSLITYFQSVENNCLAYLILGNPLHVTKNGS